MPIDKAGRFSWSKPSNYWKINESVRQLNRQKSQEFLAAGQNALSGLQTAFSNQITGSGNLAAQQAVERIKAMTSLAKLASQGVDISA
jgi:hypothetical protein